MTVSWMEICLDVTEAPPDEIAAMGRFWSDVTGLRLETYGDPADPGNLVGPPHGGGIALCPVPEPKTVKNRVHLDVYTDRIARLVGLGARVTEEHERWSVLTDPQGNEFCVFDRAREVEHDGG